MKGLDQWFIKKAGSFFPSPSIYTEEEEREGPPHFPLVLSTYFVIHFWIDAPRRKVKRKEGRTATAIAVLRGGEGCGGRGVFFVLWRWYGVQRTHTSLGAVAHTTPWLVTERDRPTALPLTTLHLFLVLLLRAAVAAAPPTPRAWLQEQQEPSRRRGLVWYKSTVAAAAIDQSSSFFASHLVSLSLSLSRSRSYCLCLSRNLFLQISLSLFVLLDNFGFVRSSSLVPCTCLSHPL